MIFFRKKKITKLAKILKEKKVSKDTKNKLKVKSLGG